MGSPFALAGLVGGEGYGSLGAIALCRAAVLHYCVRDISIHCPRIERWVKKDASRRDTLVVIDSQQPRLIPRLERRLSAPILSHITKYSIKLMQCSGLDQLILDSYIDRFLLIACDVLNQDYLRDKAKFLPRFLSQ